MIMQQTHVPLVRANKLNFPRRKPAQAPPEPQAIDFEWKPQPGMLCLMQGDGTKGHVRVRVLNVDGDTAEVRIPGGKPVKVGVHRLRKWAKGAEQQRAIEQKREVIAAAPPKRPDRVRDEPLYVMNLLTGKLLSRFSPKPDGSGYVLGWVDDLKDATPYATRNSAAIGVVRYRERHEGETFDYHLATKAQVVSLLALREAPQAPAIAPAKEPEPQALTPEPIAPPAPEPAPLPTPISTAPVVQDARMVAVQAKVEAALHEVAAADEMKAVALAKLCAARRERREVEASCACAVKP